MSAAPSPIWSASRPIPRRGQPGSSPPNPTPRRRTSKQGVLNVLDKGGVDPADGRFPGPWHHGRHQRADRTQGRQGRADHHRGLSRHARDRARQPAGFLQPALRKARALRAALSAARAAGPDRLSRARNCTPLDLSGLPAILDDFRAEGVEAVAICFLHSYANTDA